MSRTSGAMHEVLWDPTSRAFKLENQEGEQPARSPPINEAGK